MTNQEYITLRVWKQTRRKLKIIAADRDETIVETLDRLATEELQRIETKKSSETGKPGQD